MSRTEIIRRRFFITGVVQGVGFRFWARREAVRLGIAGWVRNRPDGRVEALAEGTAANMARFQSLLQEGPPHGTVSAVSVEEDAPHPGEFVTFDIAF